MRKRGFPVWNLMAAVLSFTLLAILAANQPTLHVYAQEGDDTTPPTTTISFTSEEWQNTDIAIALTCEDDVNCSQTFFCIGNENCDPIEKYQNPFGHSTEGISYISFYSNDTSGNVEDTKSQILKLDKSLPMITISEPSQGQQITGDSFVINGTATDALSDIDKVEVTINGNVNEAIVGGEIWQYQWRDIPDGTYIITANAIDNAGNVANESVSVTADNPPTARITSLGSPPIVKAERVEVTLETSEAVQYTPTLSYSFSGQGSIQVELYGSSQTWTGYMFISTSNHDKVGTFEFSGRDFNNNVGNTITEGRIFVVDAVAPAKVASINAEVDGDQLDLSWYYEGEELKQFSIYRASRSNVDYIDYYKSTPADSTSTIDDLDGKKYYYRVAAVDLAGNVGPLSEEVSAASGEEGQEESVTQESTQKTQTQTNVQTLPAYIIGKIDNLIQRIGSEITKIDKAKLILEKNSASKELGLILQLNSAKATFNGFKEVLDGLKRSTSSAREAEDKINEINLNMLSILNELPKDIALESEKSFIQETSLKDVESVIAIIGSDLTPKERDLLITKNQRLQGRVEVKVTATFFRVTLFEGEKDITLIKKELSFLTSNVSVVETIPKTAAASVREVNFITQGYDVLKDDPVVRWNSNINEVKYSIDKKLSQDELRQVKTLVISEDSSSFGFFTGLAVLGRSAISTISDAKMFIGIIILSLLIVFYFTYLRNGDVKVYKERRKSYDPYKGYMSFTGSSMPTMTSRKASENEVRLGEYAKPLSNSQQKHLHSMALMPKNIFTEHFGEMVGKANDYANNGNFALASKTYSLMLELYKMLDATSKRATYSEVLHIYNKLNLYSKIKELETAEKANLNINPRNLLKHVYELYSVVAKTDSRDTKFLRFVREYYDFSISRRGR